MESSAHGADEATEAASRLRSIRDALEKKDPGRLDPETQTLMLRELVLERLRDGRQKDALELAQRMVDLGVLSDLGHHEIARIHSMKGDHIQAAEADLLAARAAPPERRAFFWWSVATHREHAGQPERALEALRRASRWATEAGRPLYRAHAAAIRLGTGRGVRDLASVIAGLMASPQREGYGRYLLGTIAHHTGDPRSTAHLQAFLRRHASSDPLVLATLRIELGTARRLLRGLNPKAV